MRNILLLIKKDSWLHQANFESFLTCVLMTTTVFFITRLSVEADLITEYAAGSYWTAFFITGYLTLNRILQIETLNQSFQAILISGVPSSSVFIASNLSLIFFFSVSQLVILPIHALFFGIDWTLLNYPLFLLIFFLVAIGFNAVISVIGVLVSEIKFNEFLLPLLCFPLQIPLLLAAVTLSNGIIQGEDLSVLTDWIKMLFAFDTVFLLLGYIIYTVIFD